MNDLDTTLISNAYKSAIDYLEEPEEMTKSSIKKGVSEDWAEIITKSAFKVHKEVSIENFREVKSKLFLGIILLMVSLGISVAGYKSGVWFITSGFIITGISYFVWSLNNFRNFRYSEQLVNYYLNELKTDNRISEYGNFYALKKVEIPDDVIDFVNENFNNLYKNKYFTARVIKFVDGTIIDICCFDVNNTNEQMLEIMKVINSKFDLCYVMCSNYQKDYHKWLREAQPYLA